MAFREMQVYSPLNPTDIYQKSQTDSPHLQTITIAKTAAKVPPGNLSFCSLKLFS